MDSLTPKDAPKYTDIGRRSVFKCFKCGKAEHRAVDCRGDTAKTLSSAEKPVFIGFSCGQQRHKRVECSNRQGNRDAEENTEKSAQKVTQKKQVRNSPVILKDIDKSLPSTTATVGDIEITVYLDSCAQMTVLPEEMVPPR